MRNFVEFFTKFVTAGTTNLTFTIYGKTKTIKAMSLMTSEHYQPTIGNYFKVVFNDDSLLIVIPDEQIIQYADHELGEIKSISDDQVGEDQIVKYDGQEYKLENAHDYQFVLQKIVGGINDIEGECQFSDYVNVNDPDDCLSVAWISYDGRRSDVRAKTLNIKDINVL